MEILTLIVAIFLLIVSIIDFKLHCVPSIILTAMLFAVAVLNPNNLWIGILGFIMAYLLYEINFFDGMADIKVLTIIAFMIGTVNWLFTFIILICIFGFAWKVFIKWRLTQEENCAFLPVFLFCYLALWILGGIA